MLMDLEYLHMFPIGWIAKHALSNRYNFGEFTRQILNLQFEITWSSVYISSCNVVYFCLIKLDWFLLVFRLYQSTKLHQAELQAWAAVS